MLFYYDEQKLNLRIISSVTRPKSTDGRTPSVILHKSLEKVLARLAAEVSLHLLVIVHVYLLHLLYLFMLFLACFFSAHDVLSLTIAFPLSRRNLLHFPIQVGRDLSDELATL